MPEIGTFGLMSGDGKRSDGHRPQATAPILDFTAASLHGDDAVSGVEVKANSKWNKPDSVADDPLRTWRARRSALTYALCSRR